MVNDMLHKGFKFVLISLAVLYSQAIYPGLGSLPVVKSTSGYVGAVGVVTGADGKPILAEFGSDGLIVRDLPYSAEEVSILPASAYRAMQQLLQTYLTEHGDSGDRLAVGARLMPAAQYKSLNLVTNTAASEPVTRPDLESDQTRSVLVIDERKILTPNPPYEAVVLMEFPVDLSADETLADTDLSLLIDADGRVVYKSAYDISFKVDFYKDEKATNGFERLWAPVGGMPLFGLYGGAPTFPDGKYHLTEIWPACPGFSYHYKTMITAKVYYSDFNPKNQSGGAHYVPVVKEGFVSCSGGSASLLSTPSLGAQMTGLAMQGVEANARSANIVGDQDFNLSLIHISEPTRPELVSRMPSSA